MTEGRSPSAYDNPVCIVCTTEITPDQDCTRSPDGYWWHFRCRRGVDEAYARLTAPARVQS